MTIHHLPPYPSERGRSGWFDADLVRDRDHLTSADISRIAARRHHLTQTSTSQDHRSARPNVFRGLLSKLRACRHHNPAAAPSPAAGTVRRTPAPLAES